MGTLFIVIICFFSIIVSTINKYSKEIEKEKERYSHIEKLYKNITKSYILLEKEYSSIKKKHEPISDAQEEAQKIISEAKTKAEKIIATANEKADKIEKEINKQHLEAQKILETAQKKAREIAGNAIDARDNAILYELTAKSMKNIILGYGNDYLIPSHTLLDDIAETYGYSQASKDYKDIRAQIREMVKNNQAATCDYVENLRKQTAISFITDAFNGKADTILTSAKADNFGTLKQKLIDTFNIVNYNGSAFRNAKITEEYFNARLEELRLACVINEIRKKDMEEQRRIKEQIREEEKARREIERALRDAEKEEEMLQKAMEKAKAQLEKANAEQRATYEAQIAELEKKYQEAEERNKRALSMAQQTKSGHIYIISNEGSFGSGIYKIGMTRRLEPIDRIKELSNASVPFAFDVHAFIWSEDAPALETMLHKQFALYQVNKVNFRKEFFKIPLSEIRAALEDNNLNIKWTMTARASEYRESLAIEKAIKDNPQAREDWLNHQLEINTSDFISSDEGEEENLS